MAHYHLLCVISIADSIVVGKGKRIQLLGFSVCLGYTIAIPFFFKFDDNFTQHGVCKNTDLQACLCVTNVFLLLRMEPQYQTQPEHHRDAKSLKLDWQVTKHHYHERVHHTQRNGSNLSKLQPRKNNNK